MTKLVGILNYTLNSFSDGGKYASKEQAIQAISDMFSQGADIVDVGASATSYGAKLCTSEEEMQKLLPLLLSAPNKEKLSLDTFHTAIAAKAIEIGLLMINDVSGGKDPKMLELIAANSAVKYVCMFSLVLPANQSIRIRDVQEIYAWGERKIAECIAAGIAKEQLIFDLGIGFVTDAKQSLEVIRNIRQYKSLGVPIYIGHSRKSFLETLTNLPPAERDVETLAASLYMLSEGVDYVRVHNVDWHKRAFRVLQNLYSQPTNKNLMSNESASPRAIF